jgi:hypothetical protein
MVGRDRPGDVSIAVATDASEVFVQSLTTSSHLRVVLAELS